METPVPIVHASAPDAAAGSTRMQALQGPDIEPPSDLDRVLHARLAKLTQGLAPASMALAWIDWGMHLAASPGKWLQLVEKAWRKDARWFEYAMHAAWCTPSEPCITPLPQDRRFRDPAWERWPYNLLQQGFLLNQQWWHNATTGIDGVSRHHQDVVEFSARQILDLVSPVNFIATNPEVTGATLREHGANLVRGAANLIEDAGRSLAGQPPVGAERFRPGVEVAATPGRVVLRNAVMELIQYAPAPATATVHAEPMLIVPAWIMKYYILDLSPHNSLVRYLVESGHTVFMISWHNPNEADRERGMDDYVRDGVQAALAYIAGAIPDTPINSTGYCLGGTLLSIAVAASSEDAAPINSMTLLAAQTDFSEAGELMLFIDESQIDWLEDMMWEQGYLDNRQMAGAFQLLRSHDLVWSSAVNQYLLGRRAPMTDLMAWNTDTTRMPARMHSEYLRKLFLNNDLFCGRYRVAGRPVALSDIRVPMFAVATLSDHVSPWRSVHKLHLLTGFDLDFVLTSGGHNAGIISEPGHKNRRYFYARRHTGARYIDPDRWLETAAERDGSWWPTWKDWLERISTGAPVPARVVPDALGAAPGKYVLER